MSFLFKAQSIWDDFARYKINDYAKLRNFDFGPNNESSVSKLSPFITPVSYTHLRAHET